VLRYAVSGFLPAIGMSNAEALRGNTSVAADHSGMDIDRSRDGSRRVNGRCQVLRLRLTDDIDGDLHRRNRSSVLKPVCGCPATNGICVGAVCGSTGAADHASIITFIMGDKAGPLRYPPPIFGFRLHRRTLTTLR